MTDNILIFNSRDELLRIETGKIVYFEANGNYTSVVTKNKLKGTISMSMLKMESMLAAQLGEQAHVFMRIGKRYIINRNFIYQINITKQRLILSDLESFAFQLSISKDALRKVKELTSLTAR